MKLQKILAVFLLPAIAIILLGFTLISVSKAKEPPKRSLLMMPPTSPFKHKVAGLGILEPATRLINVSPNVSGVLTKLYVMPGDKIQAGDPIFALDDRAVSAQLKDAQTKLSVARVAYEDAADSLALYESVKDKRAISLNDLHRQKFAAQKAKMSLEAAIAQVEAIQTNLDLLVVRSLIDGTVLKVNTNLGEFIGQNASAPPVLIGDLDEMNVRVEVDEADISRVGEDAPAVGILRGRNKRVPLKFVRVEPYSMPKQNLSNDVKEKVDTRVVEIIYAFNNSKVGALPGQQMDVFIEESKGL